MSLDARSIIRLALDEVFGGVRPTGYRSTSELTHNQVENMRRAFYYCATTGDFENVMMLLSAFLGGGVIGDWEAQACTEYIADLTDRLESQPFHLTVDEGIDSVDEVVPLREFYVSATIAAYMIGCSLHSLSMQHKRGKIIGKTTGPDRDWLSKSSGSRLLIPISYVDQRKAAKVCQIINQSKKANKKMKKASILGEVA